MKTILLLALGGILASAFPTTRAAAAEDTNQVRVLIFTGGHAFEKEPFFQVFKDNPDIRYTAAEHPAAQALLRPESAKNFDVLVTYDLYQPIPDETKEDLKQFLKSGKGFVVLHHAIASYQSWPEYQEIIGAHYYLQATNVNGVAKARSAYSHGVTFKVHVVDPTNPVTKGLGDYEIQDETYRLFDVFPGSTILLTTKEPLSNPEVGWTRRYGAGKVVYIQGGHDHLAYENPNFRKLLGQAIRWAAGRE